MGDYLHNCNLRHSAAVKEIGLAVGDFVKVGHYSCWREVVNVWFEDDRSPALSVATPGDRHPSSFTFAHDVEVIHKAGEPWNYREVDPLLSGLNTKDGRFGYKDSPPVPEPFWYKGTFSLEAWLWNYNNRRLNTMPKEPRPLQPYLEAAGVPGEGIPYDKAWEVKERVEAVRIDRWKPHIKLVAESTPSTTVDVRKYIEKNFQRLAELTNTV